jgi:hypothetical protein
MLKYLVIPNIVLISSNFAGEPSSNADKPSETQNPSALEKSSPAEERPTTQFPDLPEPVKNQVFNLLPLTDQRAMAQTSKNDAKIMNTIPSYREEKEYVQSPLRRLLIRR